jgi:hypothetical protein
VCVCEFLFLFIYLFVCVGTHSQCACLAATMRLPVILFLLNGWTYFRSTSFCLMIFWVWHIFICTLFCLLVVIFIWKVNTLYGFDLSWYLNDILFTLYKYTMIAHVLREKFSILEGISVKNMLIRLGWICRKNYIICIMFPEQFTMVI